MKYYQGKFKIQHPEKYVGDIDKIIFRSGLEFQFFKFFDSNSSIVSWGSEEFFILYPCQLDNKMHRYFPDIFIIYKTKDDKLQKAICEIKPLAFCSPPPKPKRMTQGYYDKCNDYIKNQNKWDAAKIFCKNNNLRFIILTEQDLKKRK
jgi:hypothetical protein